jgi:hypothetical protein
MEHDRQDNPLIAFADRAVAWMYSNLGHFLPLHAKNELEQNRAKPLGELALICWLMQRNPTFAKDYRLNSIIASIHELYNKLSLSEDVSRTQETFLTHVLIAGILHKCGLISVENVNAVQVIVNRSAAIIPGFAPFTLPTVRYLYTLGGFAHQLPSYDSLYMVILPRASCSHQPNLDEFDAYQLTHALFYYSDFGRCPEAIFAAQVLKGSLQSLEPLLEKYISKRHWDLVAELLICCQCVQHPCFPLYALGWKHLLKAQYKSGLVPGPGCRLTCVEPIVPEQERSVFVECYHTTLVSALAGALCSWRE